MALASHDLLLTEISAAAQIRDARTHLLARTKDRQFVHLEIVNLDELIRRLETTILPVLTSPVLSGAVDGARLGIEMPDHITVTADGLELTDIPALDFGIPIGTAVAQSLRQSILVYQGHISWTTALARISIKVTTVGVGSALGSTIGLLCGGPLGAFIGGVIGGCVGGRTRAVRDRTRISLRPRRLCACEGTMGGSDRDFPHLLERPLAAEPYHRIDRWYKNTLREVPQAGCYEVVQPRWRKKQGVALRQRKFHLLCLTAARLTERVTRTRTIARTNWGTAVRKRAAAMLARLNQLDQFALEQQSAWFDALYQKVQAEVQNEFQRALENQTALITSMVKDLNDRYAIVRTALRRLGRAGRRPLFLKQILGWFQSNDGHFMGTASPGVRADCGACHICKRACQILCRSTEGCQGVARSSPGVAPADARGCL